MFKVTWKHTRKNTPMVRTFPNKATALLHAMQIRTVHPQHPIKINNIPV